MKPESIIKSLNLEKPIPFEFKNDFLFGVATASTQIEGKDYNSNWSNYCKQNKIKDGSNSLICNMSYDNYLRDIKLLKDLGIQTYRFSLDWPKINPKFGVFDLDVINRYLLQIKLLKQNNIVPLVTLYHFSHPLWFEKMGGFLKKKNIKYFLEYVKVVFNYFKDEINEVCTINEPNVYAVNCYLFKEWINEKSNLFKTIKAMKNMSIAHRKAYPVIKSFNKNIKVGFAMHIQDFVINKKTLKNKITLKIFDSCFNNACLFAMSGKKFVFPFGFLSFKNHSYIDYLGINYYTQNVIDNFAYKPDDKYFKNDLGWAIVPSSLNKICKKYHNLFKKDIYITENGTCDANDTFRKEYIYTHLYVLKDLDFVKRYYYWTFMDNFEWKEGLKARFGLFYYDFENQLPYLRKSGEFYKDIIENHGINGTMIKKYF